MPGKKLTDRRLAELYYGLAKHHKESVEQRMDSADIYNVLWCRLNDSLNDPSSALYGLDPIEQQKAYTVLNTFFYAHPQYRRPQREQQPSEFFRARREERPSVRIHHHYHHQPYCCHHHDTLFTWLMLNSMMSQRPCYGAYGPGYSHHHNTHKHPSEKNKDGGSLLALLIVIAMILAAVALSFIALYYILSQTVNSLERFYYDEGCLQAGLTLMGMAAAGTASAILVSAFATAPLVSLAIAAGVSNPVGLAVFGVVCLTIIGTAVGGFLTNQIQQAMIKKSNPDALYPLDPHRFTLTDQEAEKLEAKGIDPIKVKCAIVALRAEIGENHLPSRLNRLFSSRGQAIEEHLNKIRQLRSGAIHEVDVGDMKFDCRKVLADVVPPPRAYYPEPSAPPYDPWSDLFAHHYGGQ